MAVTAATGRTAQILLALAERCEREEPSRELDQSIAKTIGFRPSWHGDDGETRFYAPGTGEGSCSRIALPYTTSRDAAATLEPADALEVCVRRYPRGMYVRITLANGDPVYCEGLRSKITEPMARCAAALRAKAAIAGEKVTP